MSGTMDNQASETITLKISVPSSSTSKTVRLPAKTKIKELHETLSKKLATAANVDSHEYDDFAFCWYSDTGPLWLAEASTLRAYNLKNNASLDFKKRNAPGVVAPTPTVVQPAQQVPSSLPDKRKIKNSGGLVRKMSAWVSGRPGSLHEKEIKKEQRSISHSILVPRRESDTALLTKTNRPPALSVNAAMRTSSPALSSTSTSNSTSTSSLSLSSRSSLDSFGSGSDDALGSGDAGSVGEADGAGQATISDLDDLIDIFDDLADEEGEDTERLLEEYALSLANADLYELTADDDDDLDILPKSEISSSPASPSPSLPSYSPSSHSQASSSPSSTNISLLSSKSRVPAYPSPPAFTTPPAYSPTHSPYSTDPSPDSFSPTRTDNMRFKHLNEGDDGDYQQVPGLSVAPKAASTIPGSSAVRVELAKSILEDSLVGIDNGTVTLPLMKQYIVSVLCILKTIT